MDGVTAGCFPDLDDRLEIDLCGPLGLIEEELLVLVVVALEGVEDDKEDEERGNLT